MTTGLDKYKHISVRKKTKKAERQKIDNFTQYRNEIIK